MPASDRRLTDVRPVAYVLTHYPATALTFIALEIREIERLGRRVVPISVNEPATSDVQSETAKAAASSTHYLKQQGARRLASALLSAWVRNPAGISKLIVLALASARLDLGLAARRVVHLAYGCWSWSTVRDQGVRHFHAHFGQTPATIAWFAAEVATLSSGERCTWSFTIHGFQDFADERVTRLDLKVASAAFVVCISDFTRAQLCRATDPAMWDRYHVVRCGIDLDALRFAPRPERGRPFRIVTVARLSPEKGHFVLLAAIRRLRDDGRDVELRIVGDGPLSDSIQAEVERLDLVGCVTLLGSREPDEVAQELLQADAFCLASFAEGIPVSIMEAMAVGLPVVTTYVGGIPELAINDETALVVPPSNSDALASALRRLVDDPALCERLTHAGRTACVDRHDIGLNVAALHDLFESLGPAAQTSS